MRALRGHLAVLVAGLCLAVPATALAQSAGDDQYADPFDQPQGQQESPPPSGSGNSGNSGNSGSGTAGTVAGTPASTAADTSTQDSSAGRLAYTGLNLPLLFVAGAVLLLAGVTVRRVLTGPYTSLR